MIIKLLDNNNSEAVKNQYRVPELRSGKGQYRVLAKASKPLLLKTSTEYWFLTIFDDALRHAEQKKKARASTEYSHFFSAFKTGTEYQYRVLAKVGAELRQKPAKAGTK